MYIGWEYDLEAGYLWVEVGRDLGWVFGVFFFWWGMVNKSNSDTRLKTES